VFNLPHTVARSTLLDASPKEVWAALTDETALREWLADEVELEPREGGAIVCRYEDGEERHGEVELVEEADGWRFAGGARGRARAGWSSCSTPSPAAPG
jgi:uncharacterized protein YndB with AHSA1/START domain